MCDVMRFRLLCWLSTPYRISRLLVDIEPHCTYIILQCKRRYINRNPGVLLHTLTACSPYRILRISFATEHLGMVTHIRTYYVAVVRKLETMAQQRHRQPNTRSIVCEHHKMHNSNANAHIVYHNHLRYTYNRSFYM